MLVSFLKVNVYNTKISSTPIIRKPYCRHTCPEREVRIPLVIADVVVFLCKLPSQSYWRIYEVYLSASFQMIEKNIILGMVQVMVLQNQL